MHSLFKPLKSKADHPDEDNDEADDDDDNNHKQRFFSNTFVFLRLFDIHDMMMCKISAVDAQVAVLMYKYKHVHMYICTCEG